MKRWMWLMVVALLVVSLACSAFGLGGDSDSAEEPPTEMESGDKPKDTQDDDGDAVAQPGGEEEETAGEEDGDAGDDDADLAIEVESLDGLDSYRARMVSRFEYDDGDVEQMTIEQDAIREPYASRMLMTSVGMSEDEGGDTSFEMIQVGSEQYIRFGEEWMQSTVEDEMSTFEEDAMVSAEDIESIADSSNYEYLGKETISGVRCRHYRFEADPDDLGFIYDLEGEEGDMWNWEKVEGEVWIADESDLPDISVRFTWTATGELDDGRTGKLIFEHEVYDINASFTIEPPAEALSGGLPEDVPMYPDATGITSMAGFVTFTAPDDVDTVTAFYDEQLAAFGWTKGGDEFFPEWEKDGRTLQLMISEDDAGASVTIMLNEGE